MNEFYDVAIVGSGPAGLTTAIYSARAGLKVALIERGLYGGALNDTVEVENYSAFTTISGMGLAEKMEEHVRSQDGIDHIYGDVKRVSKNADESFTTEMDDKVVLSRTVVIATGVKYKKLHVTGEEEYAGTGVSNCVVCDINFFKNKPVIMIGGGDSAVEGALYASNVADSVTLVHRRDELRAEKILQDRLFEKDNIRVVWNADTEAIKGEDGKVTGIVYQQLNDDGNRYFIEGDGVFVNVGIEPVTEPFSHFGSKLLTNDRYIRTNSRMETEIEGLFAVGDVRHESIRQVVTATGDGAVASESIIKYLRERGD